MHLRSSAVLRSAATLSAATLAILAACADPARVTAPSAGGLNAGRDLEFNSPRHVFHTKEYFARQDAADGGQRYARPSAGGGTGISYHGGTVLQSGTKVVAIYWNVPSDTVSGYLNLPTGTGTGTADGSLIGTFLNSLSSLSDAAGTGNYYKINGTYWGPGGSATTNRIVPTVTYTGYWNTASTAGAPKPSASPTDADMAALIQSGLDSGRIAYNDSTVYAIFTGRNVNLGGGFGSQYCAYHTHATTTQGKLFYYAAMPYNQQYPSGCTSQFASPNADKAANSEVNTLAHEIEETTTDDMGNAWYDNRGYENADKCAWTWGTTQTLAGGGVYNQSYNGKYFLVQQNWVNAGSGGCATGYNGL